MGSWIEEMIADRNDHGSNPPRVERTTHRAASQVCFLNLVCVDLDGAPQGLASLGGQGGVTLRLRLPGPPRPETCARRAAALPGCRLWPPRASTSTATTAFGAY
eukprot:1195863-Prorocentrum_minimum.AAC.1